jgi:hypothetical protein
MAKTPIPPPPRTNDPREIHRWLVLVFKALDFSSIAWGLIDFTGSDLVDIETRNHNDLQFTRKTKTADYTIISTDDTVFGDATAGMVTITLPTAVGAEGPHTIIKIDDTLNVVRVAAQPGEQVAQGSFFDLEWQQEAIEVTSDGSEWW